MIADTTFLIGLIGEDGLQRLVEGWGGLSLLVPKVASEADWLAVLEPEAAARLMAACGGDKIYIPKCDGAPRARRDAAIVAAYGKGARVADLAREHKLTERWVWAILGRPVAVGQGELF
jgi:hypothetical protein